MLRISSPQNMALNFMTKLLPILYAAPMILLSIGSGCGLSKITELHWESGSLFAAVVMILIGTWVFEDDARLMIEDREEDIEASENIERDVHKNSTINYLLVLFLAGLGVWLQVRI